MTITVIYMLVLTMHSPLSPDYISGIVFATVEACERTLAEVQKNLTTVRSGQCVPLQIQQTQKPRPN